MTKLLISIFYLKNDTYILALEMASPRNQHCANCIGSIGTLSFPIGRIYPMHAMSPMTPEILGNFGTSFFLGGGRIDTTGGYVSRTGSGGIK